MGLASLGSTSGTTPRYGLATLYLMLDAPPLEMFFCGGWTVFQNVFITCWPIKSRSEQLTGGKSCLSRSHSASVLMRQRRSPDKRILEIVIEMMVSELTREWVPTLGFSTNRVTYHPRNLT